MTPGPDRQFVSTVADTIGALAVGSRSAVGEIKITVGEINTAAGSVGVEV
jgi:hypothetical protein